MLVADQLLLVMAEGAGVFRPLKQTPKFASRFQFPTGFTDPREMKLRPAAPPLTCQLAMPASAGANPLQLPEHAVASWILQLAPQSKISFISGV
jgi:hypothetical protein